MLTIDKIKELNITFRSIPEEYLTNEIYEYYIDKYYEDIPYSGIPDLEEILEFKIKNKKLFIILIKLIQSASGDEFELIANFIKNLTNEEQELLKKLIIEDYYSSKAIFIAHAFRRLDDEFLISIDMKSTHYNIKSLIYAEMKEGHDITDKYIKYLLELHNIDFYRIYKLIINYGNSDLNLIEQLIYKYPGAIDIVEDRYLEKINFNPDNLEKVYQIPIRSDKLIMLLKDKKDWNKLLEKGILITGDKKFIKENYQYYYKTNYTSRVYIDDLSKEQILKIVIANNYAIEDLSYNTINKYGLEVGRLVMENQITLFSKLLLRKLKTEVIEKLAIEYPNRDSDLVFYLPYDTILKLSHIGGYESYIKHLSGEDLTEELIIRSLETNNEINPHKIANVSDKVNINVIWQVIKKSPIKYLSKIKNPNIKKILFNKYISNKNES